MNRRSFARNLAGAALGSAALPHFSSAAGPGADSPNAPFGLSVMLWTVFRNLPFEQRLENVAAAGYKQVELVGEFKKWSDSDYQQFNQKKRALGMTFDATSGIGMSLANPAERQTFLTEVRNILPTLDRLECPALIILAGNCIPGMPRYMQYQSCIDGLKQAAEIVEGKNVRILLENIDPIENPRYFLTSVAEGLEVIRAVNHPQIKFLCDFYHEQIAEGNLIAKVEKNLDQIGLVHIADVPGRHEPGTGEINFQNIFKKLAELGYQHNAAMEYMPTYDEIKSLSAARKFALDSAALAGQPANFKS
ncbi:MAG TPA: TIM barrel protein [Terriglobia bacterium]|nr:TIM barrel protein [Terriglobia bacterium]